MVERFLFNWINAVTAGASIGRENNPRAFTGAHKAQSTLAVMQPAVARTEIALDAPILDFVPIPANRGVLKLLHAI